MQTNESFLGLGYEAMSLFSSLFTVGFYCTCFDYGLTNKSYKFSKGKIGIFIITDI